MGLMETLESIAPGFIARPITEIGMGGELHEEIRKNIKELQQQFPDPSVLVRPLKDLEITLKHPELVDAWNILQGIKLCKGIQCDFRSAIVYFPYFRERLSIKTAKKIGREASKKIKRGKPKSEEWGVVLLSVYFLGAHFRIGEMYLKQLEGEEMIKLQRGEYRITPKGERYIERFEEMLERAEAT